MVSVFDKLKQARELLNLSQIEAATQAGLDQRDISKLENGKAKFIPSNYIQFLHGKGIDINSLYNEKEGKVRVFISHSSFDAVTPADYSTNYDTVLAKTQIPGVVKEPNASVNASPTASPTGKKAKKSVQFMPQVITVDQSGEENILYVPVQARAGYLVGRSDPDFLQTLPAFRLPGLRNATYRMFDVSGPSMAPTIGDGDKVISSFVESIDDIIDDRVYVVVTHDGIVVKRVLNRVSARGKLVLKSDTVAHRQEFRTYEIDYDSVVELWYCRMKLSGDFSAPSEIYSRLNELESDVTELKSVNTSLLFQMDEIRRIVHEKLL